MGVVKYTPEDNEVVWNMKSFPVSLAHLSFSFLVFLFFTCRLLIVIKKQNKTKQKIKSDPPKINLTNHNEIIEVFGIQGVSDDLAMKSKFLQNSPLIVTVPYQSTPHR